MDNIPLTLFDVNSLLLQRTHGCYSTSEIGKSTHTFLSTEAQMKNQILAADTKKSSSPILFLLCVKEGKVTILKLKLVYKCIPSLIIMKLLIL